jgi:hypothetical protein
MKPVKYALYPPAEPGLPWLAVTLEGVRPTAAFGCYDRKSAERVLKEIQVRIDAKASYGSTT